MSIEKTIDSVKKDDVEFSMISKAELYKIKILEKILVALGGTVD